MSFGFLTSDNSEVGEWMNVTFKRTPNELLKNAPTLDEMFRASFSPEELAELEQWAKEHPELC